MRQSGKTVKLQAELAAYLALHGQDPQPVLWRVSPAGTQRWDVALQRWVPRDPPTEGDGHVDV